MYRYLLRTWLYEGDGVTLAVPEQSRPFQSRLDAERSYHLLVHAALPGQYVQLRDEQTGAMLFEHQQAHVIIVI